VVIVMTAIQNKTFGRPDETRLTLRDVTKF
jgi:hypothetical protein